jgi:hypothetical protein
MSSKTNKVQNPYSSPTNNRNSTYSSYNSSTKRVATEAAAFSPGTNIVAPVHKSLPMHPSNKKKKAVPSTISASSSASSTRSSCTSTVASSTGASTATGTVQSPPAFQVDGPTGGSNIATSHSRSRGKIEYTVNNTRVLDGDDKCILSKLQNVKMKKQENEY